jgi:hypothetical protein
MSAPVFIAKSQSVVDHFGRWPSFHDANVLAYEAPSPAASHLGFTLHTWTMTSEVDSKGFFVLKDHALVTFRFDGLSDLSMEEFAAGNILFGMALSQSADFHGFHVELESVMDMSGSFTALSGEVMSIVLCSSDGKPARPGARATSM